MAATRDMTRGHPMKLLLTFALPLMIGSVFQQMYTMVDAAVVGQFIGVQALAAVGSADWINWMITSSMQGFTQGFCILAAQRFGGGDLAGLRRSVATAIRLTAVIAVVSTVVCLLGARPLLTLLNTPAEIIDQSFAYLSVCILGITVIAGYNLFAAILRALGDSRNPLVAMIIAACLNVALDLLFVLVFRWGVAGAAAATVTGQAFSCLYCLWCVRRVPQLRLDRADWRREPGLTGRMLRLGVPMAAQNAIISVGGLAVQRVVNGFGAVFMAGYTAASKLYGILEMAAIAYGYALSTYCGQNLGARQYRRIRRGVSAGAVLSVLTSVCISVLIFTCGRLILSLFISAEDPLVAAEAMRVGLRFLRFMASLLFVLYLLLVYRSSLQGLGDTVIPMISGFVELVMRILAVAVLPAFLGEDGVFIAEVAAWTGATVLLAAAYYYRAHKLPRDDASPSPSADAAGALEHVREDETR